MKKKILSFLLVLSLLVTLIVPFTVTTASADGTAIANQSELAGMSATGNYYLANDITISSSWNYSSAAFTGTLDGKGHTITFADSTAVTGGLFQALGRWDAGATIKNLNIVYGSVTWTSSRFNTNHWAYSRCIGGVAGSVYSNNGLVTIQNVTVIANISKSDDFNGFAIGGILGEVRQGTVNITNCAFNGSINGTNTNAKSGFGGIVGHIYDGKSLTISKCVNNGSVTGSVNVGGILGGSIGAGGTALTISQCVNRGNITCSSNAYAGGIVGYVKQNGSAVTIQNNINYGNVTDNASSATPSTLVACE